MPWWFRTIFVALVLCFLGGLFFGLAVWIWRRRREVQSYERLRLEREAESDRLRLRISSLQSKEERVGELEAEVVELRQRAERLAAIQGQLSDAQTLANRVPELERQIIDLGLRANQAADDSDMAALRASTAELRSAQGEVARLKAELETAKAGAVIEDVETSPPVEADQEPEPSWQQGTTELGTPGADHSDDLKAINGIGPVMERTLNDLGIKTWEQIATFTADDIEKVSAAISTFPGRIERDDWVGGASELLASGHVPGEDTSGRPLSSNRRRRK